MAASLTVEIVRSPNWTEQETSDILAVWDKADVQWQFGLGTQANAYIYEAIVAQMRECSHEQSGWQCHIKIKAL